jgi:TonB family protein
MKDFIKKLSDFNKSVLLSVAFHIVLMLLFLLFRSGLDFPDQEFAEIGFVAASTSRAYRPSPAQNSTPAKSETPQGQQEAPAPPPSTQPKQEAKAPPVNLPKRRMMEDEDPDLRKRDSGKLTPAQENSKVTPRDDVYDSDSMQKQVAERASRGKDFSQPSQSRDTGASSSPASDVGVDSKNQPYTLEGDASKRTIVNQVLPEYPPGLQREAVVKIRFWVLPDGRVGAMIPVQKGDPQLEEITMKAIRQWRFNSLPPGEEQENVQGVITFVYKLQ